MSWWVLPCWLQWCPAVLAAALSPLAPAQVHNSTLAGTQLLTDCIGPLHVHSQSLLTTRPETHQSINSAINNNVINLLTQIYQQCRTSGIDTHILSFLGKVWYLKVTCPIQPCNPENGGPDSWRHGYRLCTITISVLIQLIPAVGVWPLGSRIMPASI